MKVIGYSISQKKNYSFYVKNLKNFKCEFFHGLFLIYIDYSFSSENRF